MTMVSLREVPKDYFVREAQTGDAGLTRGGGALGWFENLWRKKDKEGDTLMTHAFVCKGDGKISESSGHGVEEAELSKYLGGKRHTVFFRWVPIHPADKKVMLSYMKGSEQSGGRYSVLKIWDYARNFFVKKENQKWPEREGVICSQHLTNTERSADVPFCDGQEPGLVTPTDAYTWLTHAGIGLSWVLWGECVEDRYYVNDAAASR